MSAEHHFWASLFLSLGLPLIVAIRELVLLRRPWPPSGGGMPPAEEPAPPPPKPLPDCLIPKRSVPIRELEDA